MPPKTTSKPSAEQAPEYQVIARRYRPQTFADVVGQGTVVRTLQGELRDNRVGHAYLFSGPRGVGKTSMARIFAKALNCEKGPTADPCGVCVHCKGIATDSDMDVIEVDAATYNKREETEQLLDGIDRATFRARYKVYIIDEVHMFSIHSFNVLLKRLEEPPPRVVFILATTNPEKIPDTVISRCRHCIFDRMEMVGMVQRLGEIADREGATFAPGAREAVLEAVARASDGGMRDAQVALDQLISLAQGTIDLDVARQLLGVVDSEVTLALLGALVKRDTPACLQVVYDLVEGGRDIPRFASAFLAFLRDALMMKAGAPDALISQPAEIRAAMMPLVARTSLPFLLNATNLFAELEEKLRGAAPPRFVLEIALIKLTAIDPRLLVDGWTGGGASPPAGGPERVDTPAPASPPAPMAAAPALRANADSHPAPMVAEPTAAYAPARPVRAAEGSAAPARAFQTTRAAAEPMDDEAAYEAYLYGNAPDDAPSAEVQELTFDQAKEKYPEFARAVELAIRYTGAPPVSFDGRPLNNKPRLTA